MSRLHEALRELPGADLLESDDAYLLVVDAPGATEETVDASVAGSRLTVEVRRPKELPEGFDYRQEERPVFLDVDLPLPPDATGIEGTTVERGVLELQLGKTDGPPVA